MCYTTHMEQEKIREVMRILANRGVAARRKKYGRNLSEVMKQVRAGKKLKAVDKPPK